MQSDNMTAKSIVKNVRVTPRKARLVVDLIRGKKVTDAVGILKMTPKGASIIVEKAVKSAAANAVVNNKMDKEKLFIKEIYVNDGLTIKRFLPRAKGSADRLLKRTSHITVVLAERE